MTAMVSVCHLYPSLTANADGAAAVVRSLAREQLLLGTEVYFGPHRIEREDQLSQLRLTWLDVLRAACLVIKTRFNSQLGIQDCDPPKVIHVHGLWDVKVLLLSLFYKRKSDVRVHSTHGMMSSFSFNDKKFKKLSFHFLFQMPIIKGYKIHIANSTFELADLRKHFHSNSIISIPNGVDSIPQSFRLSSNRCSILYFGRIHRKKNLHLLIEGFGLVQRSVQNLKLEIIGTGDPRYLIQLEELIRKNGIQNIEFKPAIEYDKRFEAFQNALVTALPSKNENFGLVVAESLACGVPVIVSENMPWEDVAMRGCGWVVNTTPESIAEAIKNVSKKSESELIAMGRRGAKWIRDDFSWQQINQRILDLYRELLAEAAGRVELCSVSYEREP